MKQLRAAVFSFFICCLVHYSVEVKCFNVFNFCIFQGWDDPYVPRTHEGLLKWKYANMNSVDFLFEVAFLLFS